MVLLLYGDTERRVPGDYGAEPGRGAEAFPDRGRGDAGGRRRGYGDRAAVPVVAGRGQVRQFANPRAAAAALRRLRGHRQAKGTPWLTGSSRGSMTPQWRC